MKTRELPKTPLTESKFEKFARLVVCILMILVMGFLTLVSLLHTCGMDIVPNLEQVTYLNDSFYLNIIILALSISICFIVMPRLKKIPLWAELLFISVWTIVLGMIWVYSSNSAPTEDSGTVTGASLAFASDNSTSTPPPISEDNRYFRNYSFQLGYVFFNELLIRFAGLFGEVENLLFLEALNVVFLAASYVGIILINDMLFEDKRVRHLTVFLLALSMQPVIFCSFLYGIFPGLVFAVWAVYLEIRWLKKSEIHSGIISAVLIGIAVLLKSNYNIALIAMLAVAFVKLFTRKKYIMDAVYMLLCCVTAFSLPPAVKGMYESRYNVDLGEPVPYISWIAMGMNEPTFEGCGPGWYNAGCTIGNYEENNFDPDAASKDSVQNIKDRLAFFAENRQYANNFFYQKIVSQWNETTYQSIWNNKVRGQYKEKTGIAKWACDREKGENAVEGFMDIYAQLIFAAVLLGVIACLRNKDLLAVMFPLIILGGFLYHLISEAKSQYSMPYFVLMTGFAAYGITSLYDIFEKYFKKIGWLSRLMGCDDKSMKNV